MRYFYEKGWLEREREMSIVEWMKWGKNKARMEGVDYEGGIILWMVGGDVKK